MITDMMYHFVGGLPFCKNVPGMDIRVLAKRANRVPLRVSYLLSEPRGQSELSALSQRHRTFFTQILLFKRICDKFVALVEIINLNICKLLRLIE